MSGGIAAQPVSQKPSHARIVFRCDGNAEAGLGHVSRSIGLAEALQEIGQPSLFAGNYSAPARMLLESAGLPFEILPTLTEESDAADSWLVLEQAGSRVVVTDSYRISEHHLAGLSERGAQVVFVDDFAHLKSYSCAVLLNFTVDAAQLPYPQRGLHRLLGPGYMLTRRPLRRLRAQSRRNIGPVRRLLIAIGGTDRHGLALRLVETLRPWASDLTVRVTAGAAHAEQIAELLKDFVPGSAVLERRPDLVDEYTAADACISGGGLAKYECGYLGLPGAVFSQTKDQADETIDFAGRGLAFDLGLGPEQSDEQLAQGVREFLENTPLRASLSEKGLATFPVDPTKHAAEEILRLVGQPLSTSPVT